MKRLFLILSTCIALGALSGCAKATCETIADECGLSNDWEEDCVDDYKDGDGDCRRAMRDYADCVEDHGCDLSCVDEAEDVLDEC